MSLRFFTIKRDFYACGRVKGRCCLYLVAFLQTGTPICGFRTFLAGDHFPFFVLPAGRLLSISLAEQVSYCKLRLASCGIASVPLHRGISTRGAFIKIQLWYTNYSYGAPFVSKSYFKGLIVHEKASFLKPRTVKRFCEISLCSISLLFLEINISALNLGKSSLLRSVVFGCRGCIHNHSLVHDLCHNRVE